MDMEQNQPISSLQKSKSNGEVLTGVSIATHCNTALLMSNEMQPKHGASLHVKPSKQVQEALEFGWIVFGLAFAKSEAISHEVIAAKFLGGLNDPDEYPITYQKMMQDIQTLSDGGLRNKYPLEYNSHRNAKAAPKTRAIAFDPRLINFRNFLRHMGPCPANPDGDKKKRFTLERIKGKTSPYRIGNLEWASKRKQTCTRKVTRWHKLKDGTSLTVMQLAVRSGKKYNTVYKQLAAGKSPDEILAHVPTDLMAAWTWPHHLRNLEEAYKNRTKHKQNRLIWAIELFRRYLDDALSEEINGAAEELRNELWSLESERDFRAGKMKADKKTNVLTFIASIKAAQTNPFLDKVLPAPVK